MQGHEQRIRDRKDTDRRTCDDCGAEMVLAAALPRLGVLPALRSYRCAACGNVELEVLEHLRPATAPAAIARVRRGREVG
jgi:hypothetical protein